MSGIRPPSLQLVTVFGASGFVGRHLVRVLAKRGYRILAAVRRPDLAGHLMPLGGVGQIQAVQANLRDRASVERALKGADVAVNLVGVLKERGRQRFETVHAMGARLVAEAARRAGISRLVHMSALGAAPDAPSRYARSKAQGEAAVLAIDPQAVVFRPSVVFGPEDQLFNRFAALARVLPVLPLVGADIRFQPVFVGDVAEAMARAVDGNARGGAIYELGGPEARSLREIVDYVRAVTGRKCLRFGLPFRLGYGQAAVIEFLDRATLGAMPQDFVVTRDQVRMLSRDNVVSEAATQERRTLAGLSIEPTGYEAIVPSYLWRFRKTGQYHVETVA